MRSELEMSVGLAVEVLENLKDRFQSRVKGGCHIE